MKILRKIFISFEVLIVFLCLGLNASYFGAKIFTGEYRHLGFVMSGNIVSRSMVPEYEIGDKIFYYEKDFSKIEVGDDICYVSQIFTEDNDNPMIIMHRVIEKGEDSTGKKYVITQGIANSGPDFEIVTEELYAGKVITKHNLNMVTIYTALSAMVLAIIFIETALCFYKDYRLSKEQKY